MNKNQLKVFFLFLLVSLPVSLFAQSSSGGLGNLGLGGLEGFATTLAGIFSSGLVRAILVMCLCGCAVAYGFNKDNEKMKRNIIAIAVAIAILAAASKIVEAVFTAAGN